MKSFVVILLILCIIIFSGCGFSNSTDSGDNKKQQDIISVSNNSGEDSKKTTLNNTDRQKVNFDVPSLRELDQDIKYVTSEKADNFTRYSYSSAKGTGEQLADKYASILEQKYHFKLLKKFSRVRNIYTYELKYTGSRNVANIGKNTNLIVNLFLNQDDDQIVLRVADGLSYAGADEPKTPVNGEEALPNDAIEVYTDDNNVTWYLLPSTIEFLDKLEKIPNTTPSQWLGCKFYAACVESDGSVINDIEFGFSQDNSKKNTSLYLVYYNEKRGWTTFGKTGEDEMATAYLLAVGDVVNKNQK